MGSAADWATRDEVAHGTRGFVLHSKATGWVFLVALAAAASLLVMPSAAAAKGRGPSPTIKGTVTRTDGAALQDITVTAFAYDFETWTWSTAATTKTAGNGAYTLRVRAGTYYIVEFTHPKVKYLSEYYDDTTVWDWATWLWIDPRATLTGIDAALTRSSSLSGTVTSSQVGGPLAAALVDVYARNDWGGWDWVTNAVTDAKGSYKVTGLPPGEYRLGFNGPYGEYVQEFYDDAPGIELATSISLAEGEMATGLDAVLDSWSSLSGTVTDRRGMGIADIQVDVWWRDAWGDWYEYGSAWTDPVGAYTVPNIVAGDYRVKFADYSGRYLMEWYDDAPDRRSADTVAVGPSTDVTGVDAVLSQHGAISGTVTGADGQPLWGASIEAYHWADGTLSYVAGTSTLLNGTYLLIWKSRCQVGRRDRPCRGQRMGGVWWRRGERAGLSRRRAVQADMRGFGYPHDRLCVGSCRFSRIERGPS